MQELTFNDLKGILEYISSLDIWALPLIFSIICPIYYVFIVKILSLDIDNSPADNQQPAEPKDPKPLVSDPATTITLISTLFANFGTLITSISSALSIKYHKAKNTVFIGSSICFVIGVLMLILHIHQVEKIRNRGLSLKASFYKTGFTSIDVYSAKNYFGIDANELKNKFTKEFYVDESSNSVILVDSALRERNVNLSIDVMRNYLLNNLDTMQSMRATELINKGNQLFITDYIPQLIQKYPTEFTLYTDDNIQYVKRLKSAATTGSVKSLSNTSKAVLQQDTITDANKKPN